MPRASKNAAGTHANGTAPDYTGTMAKIRAALVREAARSDGNDENHHDQHVAIDQFAVGCLGGVAIETMASRRARVLTAIGAGELIAAQIAAALEVRSFSEIRIFSHRPVAAADRARRIGKLTAAKVTAATTPEEALHNADVVLIEREPGGAAIEMDWIDSTAHISVVGPFIAGGYGLPSGLAQRARTVASDNMAEVQPVIDTTMRSRRTAPPLVHLGTLLARFNPDRERAQTLFLSSGLGAQSLAQHR